MLPLTMEITAKTSNKTHNSEKKRGKGMERKLHNKPATRE